MSECIHRCSFLNETRKDHVEGNKKSDGERITLNSVAVLNSQESPHAESVEHIERHAFHGFQPLCATVASTPGSGMLSTSQNFFELVCSEFCVPWLADSRRSMASVAVERHSACWLEGRQAWLVACARRDEFDARLSVRCSTRQGSSSLLRTRLTVGSPRLAPLCRSLESGCRKRAGCAAFRLPTLGAVAGIICFAIRSF